MTRDRAVFLDACVLYPPLLRRLLIGAAEAGLYRPLCPGACSTSG